MASKSKLFSFLSRDHAQIAEQHLREGRKDKAAEAYARGGDFHQAAKVAAQAGDEARAVTYTLQAALGQIPEGYAEASAQEAGELLAVRGHHQEAILLFEMAKAFPDRGQGAFPGRQRRRPGHPAPPAAAAGHPRVPSGSAGPLVRLPRQAARQAAGAAVRLGAGGAGRARRAARGSRGYHGDPVDPMTRY